MELFTINRYKHLDVWQEGNSFNFTKNNRNDLYKSTKAYKSSLNVNSLLKGETKISEKQIFEKTLIAQNILNENALEEYRLKHSIYLPGRFNSIFFFDEAAIEYWCDYFVDFDYQLFRCDVKPKACLKTTPIYLPNMELPYDEQVKLAEHYFHPDFLDNSVAEYLVQGKIKVREIVKKNSV